MRTLPWAMMCSPARVHLQRRGARLHSDVCEPCARRATAVPAVRGLRAGRSFQEHRRVQCAAGSRGDSSSKDFCHSRSGLQGNKLRTGCINRVLKRHGFTGYGKTPSTKWFVSGHEFTRAAKAAKSTSGFIGCGKNSIDEAVCIRARVYSCRKSRKINVGLHRLRKNSIDEVVCIRARVYSCRKSRRTGVGLQPLLVSFDRKCFFPQPL